MKLGKELGTMSVRRAIQKPRSLKIQENKRNILII